MHLLATMPGTIADGSAAVDLAQSPGDIVMLSSADTDIALLATAQKRRRAQDPAAPRLRLAPILRLGHNFSVDLYMETVGRARLVVARLLGGSAYWPYGVERLVETCRAHGVPLALLPGDDKPDLELARVSTVPQAACRRLWRYLAEGGAGAAAARRALLAGARRAGARRHRQRVAGQWRRCSDCLLSGLGGIQQHR